MSGFQALVAAAARRRRLRPTGPSRDELEETAGRWAGSRRPLSPPLRRAGRGASDADAWDSPPWWLGTLAAADPAAGTVPDRVDWSGWVGPGQDAGLAGFMARLEAEYHRGAGAPLETLRGLTERPILVDDPIVEPGQTLELLARPVDAVLLDPALLGPESLNEAHALVRNFGAAAIFVVRRFADIEVLARELPTAFLVDRLDPETLAPRAGLLDSLLAALADLPLLRFVAGGIGDERSALAAARRPVDGVILDPDWLWSPGRRAALRGLPGLAVAAGGARQA